MDDVKFMHLHEEAVLAMAKACKLMREIDLREIESLNNLSVYEYLHQAIDFDQLCEDISKAMEKLDET